MSGDRNKEDPVKGRNTPRITKRARRRRRRRPLRLRREMERFEIGRWFCCAMEGKLERKVFTKVVIGFEKWKL